MILSVTDRDLATLIDASATFLERSCGIETIRALEKTADAFEGSWWRQGAELGWLSMLVSEKLGGGSVTGDGLMDLVGIVEQLGRHVAPGPLVTSSAALAGISGSSDAKRHADRVDEVISGATVLTWCAAGVWSGTAPCLRRDGDGFVLSGVAPRVEAAGRAGLFLVTAGDSQVLVPASAQGVTVERLPSLDFTRRLGTVSFADVQVPAEWLVGDEGAAAADVATQARTALVLQCAESVGVAERVLEFTMDYAGDRYSFGRPLASYQALKHRFSDMRTWVEASAGIVAGAAAADGADADHLASVAKAYIGDVLPQLIQDCIQIHGGIGVTWEHDIHIYLRRIELNRALYGTPADHRHQLAASAA